MTSRSHSSSQPSAAQSLSPLGDYLRVLYRRRWTAALALLVVFGYGAFSSLRKTPIYEATAQILIEKEARRATSLNSVLDQADSYYDDDFYQTQYRVLQSRALAWRAAQKLGLKAQPVTTQVSEPGMFARLTNQITGMLGAPKKVEPPPADETSAQSEVTGALLGGLSVAPIRNTHLVELVYRSPDPDFAAKAANAVAEAYISQGLAMRYSATKEATDYLNTQLEAQRARVAASEKALQDYQEDNNAVGVDDRQSIVVQRQSASSVNLTAARADRIDKGALYERVNALQGDRAALEALPAVMNSEFVQSLKTALNEQRQKKTELSARYREGAPPMVAIDREIQDTDRKLGVEIDRVVASIKADYQTAQTRERQYEQELAQQTAEATRLGRKGAAYAALQDEAKSNRELFETLLQKTKETGVSSEFKGTNIQIVDRAEVPRSPVLPNTRRDLMFAFFAGCVIAVGLAFGFEYLDSRIRTPDEIKTHLGLPFLGLVPSLAERAQGGKSPLISDPDVPATFAEAVRAIRTAVVFSSAEDGARTVVVTSTAPGEGKTVVSSNLAVALAQADQRTLIIDGDMRRPRVHEVFERLQEPGLSNVLVGTTELHTAVCRTSVPNLFVLSAGHIPPNPAELLGSARYRELIQDLRHQFDWIIVDAPPVMAVTDAVIVANGATGVVFVVGAEMTSRRHAAFAVEQLAAVRAHFIGAVLNRADVQRHGYYYSTYYRKDYTQAYTRSQ